MTNPAYEATNSDVEKLINCEIADFFAGIGQPGKPETPQEMQQQLQSRISAIFNASPNGMMQLSNELAEMKRNPNSTTIVPIVPTLDQLLAGRRQLTPATGKMSLLMSQRLGDVYRAMVSAAGGTISGGE